MRAYIIDGKSLSDDDFITITSLQGIVNKYVSITNEILYIDIDNYMNLLGDSISYEYISLEKCLKRFNGYIKGVVTYDITKRNSEVNVCSNFAAAYEAIIVDKAKLNYYLDMGYKLLADATKLDGDFIDIQRKAFYMLRDKLNKDGLIHQVVNENRYNTCLRDFAIFNKWFCFYTDETPKARKFREEVLAWAGPMRPIYGWNTDEISFVDHISKFGDYVIPSDWSTNLSALISFKVPKIKRFNINSKLEKSNRYHYLAIVVSDGDNVQWLHRGFMYESSFGQRLRSEMSYPLAFTISPMLYKLSPSVLNIFYEKGQKNEFISGVSGIGYMNPCNFPKGYLQEFTMKTADAMRKSNLSVVTLLDNLKNYDKIQGVVDTYGANPDILGGIYELDPDKYEGGAGKVFFSKNGKAFASVRHSLWAPGNDHKNVTNEYLRAMADKINSHPINIYNEEGYTVLNVHPWDINIDDLDKLVAMLDKHVKIISVAKLLRMLSDNVKGSEG